MTAYRSEIELIASDDTLEAASEFDRLLESVSPPLPSDEESYPGAWDAILEAGWLDIGEPSEDAFTIVDLVEFAERWGFHLVPAPFLTSVLARRHPAAPSSPVERFPGALTYSISKPPALQLVPFGDGATADGADDFAPSLPLAVGPVATEEVSSTLRQETAILRAAESLGAARKCLGLAVAYAMTREAYGRPIGKFQSLRHRLADMHLKIEAARGLITLAVTSPEDALATARLVTQSAREVVEGTIQVHGANGFTWEFPMHRYLRHIIVVQKQLRFAE
ncbi:acyl-CoA dehydrogenase family protein [Microbacterium sp. X-17]|uniref:acyl-CoA dehydrogenase family protein n=1 Tax=Microbacterium sp. X-17 TaxID=3144404 RepID=UPI0031F585B2